MRVVYMELELLRVWGFSGLWKELVCFSLNFFFWVWKYGRWLWINWRWWVVKLVKCLLLVIFVV